MPTVQFEVDSTVAILSLARAAKRNAFDRAMLDELAHAYTRFDDDDALRCAVLRADGDHFTGGLDLAAIGPEIAVGGRLFPEGTVDPLGLGFRHARKPIVVAVRGYCFTIGIEFALAADVCIAADDARFSQLEVKRGIFPFGGATMRFPARCGWGNAMRWMLTGDVFDAREALRIGLAQDVVTAAELDGRALAIARSIAAQAPLAVRETLASARASVANGLEAEAARLIDRARRLMGTDDAAEGVRSFVERRDGRFTGR